MRILIQVLIVINLYSCNSNHHLTEKGFSSVDASLGDCTTGAATNPVITLGSGTPGDPYIICNVFNLQAMNNDLTAHYELGRNIDASDTSTWTTGTSGTGFIPIGGCGSDYANCGVGRQFFSGSFNGLTFTINNLFINRTRGAVGLFGATSAAAVLTNIKLLNSDITGSADTGGIVARLYSALTQSYSKNSSVTGGIATGGITGVSFGDITEVSISGTVTGTATVGGLAGVANGNLTLINSSAEVSGTSEVGGLVGYADYNFLPGTGPVYGIVANQVSATGNVNSTGGGPTGGAFGRIGTSIVYDSFTTGDVVGGAGTGGFVGEAAGNTVIRRSFATGDVDGGTASFVGAFIGRTIGNTGIEDCFGTGEVEDPTSSPDVGGFLGRNDSSGVLANVYPIPPDDSTPVISDFYDPAHPVYNLGSTWDFTAIWNPPILGSSLPSLR